MCERVVLDVASDAAQRLELGQCRLGALARAAAKPPGISASAALQAGIGERGGGVGGEGGGCVFMTRSRACSCRQAMGGSAHLARQHLGDVAAGDRRAIALELAGEDA